MSDRDRFEELLDLYVEDRLKGDDLKDFKRLAGENAEWAREAREERQLVLLMKAAPRVNAPAGLMDAVLRAKEPELISVVEEEKAQAARRRAEEAEQRRRRSPISLFFWFATAAVLMAGIVTYLSLGPGSGTTSEVDIRKVAQADDKNVKDTILSTPATEAPAISTGDLRLETEPPRDVAMADASESVSSFASPSSASVGLFSRSQVDQAVTENRARIVADTAYFSTAEAVASGNPEPEPKGIEPNKRYAVVEGSEEFAEWYAPFAADLPLESRLQERQSEEVAYYILPYRVEEPARGAALRSAEYDLDAARSKITPPPSENGTALNFGGTSVAPGSTSTPLGTFDEFHAYIQQNKGSLLFYTPEREVAFEREAAEATELEEKLASVTESREAPGRESMLMTRRFESARQTTPAATSPAPSPSPLATLRPGFSGYIVYHFPDVESARAMLARLTTLSGPGVENLDFELAEVLAQPTGARLIIPYRMIHPPQP